MRRRLWIIASSKRRHEFPDRCAIAAGFVPVAGSARALKRWFNASLFQTRIGGEALLCSGIDGEVYLRNRAEPDFVIALAVADEGATVGDKDAFQVTVVTTAHQAATGIVLS